MKPMHDGLLDPKTWLERIDLLLAGLGDDASSPDRHIRKAYHLVQLAPEPIAMRLSGVIEESEFEAMLDSGHYVPAVAALIGPGHHAQHDAPTMRGCDPSLSMLAAWAGSFVEPAHQPN